MFAGHFDLQLYWQSHKLFQDRKTGNIYNQKVPLISGIGEIFPLLANVPAIGWAVCLQTSLPANFFCQY